MSDGQAWVMIASMIGMVAILLVPTYQSVRDGLMVFFSEERDSAPKIF